MSKEEQEKMYEYLDKDKDKYFDGITPNISKNRDEEGYFKDNNYSFVSEKTIEKYINLGSDTYIQYKNQHRNYYKFKRLSKIIKNKYTKKYYTNNYPYPNLQKNSSDYNKIAEIIKKEEMGKDYKIIQGEIGDCYLIAFLNGFMKFQGNKFFGLLGDCFFEIGYIEFNFYFLKGKNYLRKKVFVDDYILVDECYNDSPVFCSIKRPNNEESIYGIFQLIEKALSKANKKDFFVLDGGLIKTQYMKYLTGLKPQDIFPNELSDEDSEELLSNIIDKNVKKNNVLMAGIDKKILYNNDKFKDAKHAFTIDGFVSKNEIKLRDPSERIYNWEELDNNFIKYGKDKKDLIGININKFKNSTFLLRICPFEDIDYTDKEKKLINYEENYLPENSKEIEETSKCKEFLDYLGIDSLLRYKFFRIFENNMQEGIENLLEYFVIFGTRKYQFEYLTNSFLYLLPNDFLLVKEKNMLLEKKKEKKRKEEEEEKKRKEEEEEKKRKEED